MKKIFLIVIPVGLLATVIWFATQSQNTSKDTASSQTTNSATAGISTGNSQPPLMASATQGKSGVAAKAPLADNEAIAALRAAFATSDGAAIQAAFQKLVEYLKAHPEQVKDYCNFMRSEHEEQVLRHFALALAACEAGYLENDEIISTALTMAKDPSFEQRQHIMLNLLGRVSPERENVFKGILDIAQQDANAQVKTSAVAAMADWMEMYPDHNNMVMSELTKIFNSATDEDVKAFGYQLFALHKDKLSPEVQQTLASKLQTEQDWAGKNLIICALTSAPEEMRTKVVSQLQESFQKETDVENQRNLFAQIVALSSTNSISMVEKYASGTSPLAEDARDYVNVLARGRVEPEQIFNLKGARDARKNQPAEESPIRQRQ